jgi:hypothetical protein
MSRCVQTFDYMCYMCCDNCIVWSIAPGCSAFLTSLSTRHVLQALVLLHLDYCSVVWSGATKKGLREIAIGSEQGSTSGP